MKVQVICDGERSALNTWMQGVAKYSKHKLEIMHFTPVADPEVDIYHFQYGSFIQYYPDFIEKQGKPVGITVVGPKDFGCLASYIHGNPERAKQIKGVIVLGKAFETWFKSSLPELPTYLADVGVDMTLFPRTPPPKTFKMGFAENTNYPMIDDRHNRLIQYGYPMVTAGAGRGTERLFTEMPRFYQSISVFVDNTINHPRPGGLMFLESAASGRPCLGMVSGVMAEWFPKECICKDDEDMKAKLARLRDDSGYYKDLTDEWFKVAESRDYKIIVGEYDRAFESMLGSSL